MAKLNNEIMIKIIEDCVPVQISIFNTFAYKVDNRCQHFLEYNINTFMRAFWSNKKHKIKKKVGFL